ncbi:F510_1955 family glycosylhydrolase [Marinactinospora rubrisoli]|uniref:F510_1955 family glycosylhydrolase n=1 Tax=Marinactinospora rubrisoli TaxID=2715399 RepID=A0ABW2KGH9_9ACTN
MTRILLTAEEPKIRRARPGVRGRVVRFGAMAVLAAVVSACGGTSGGDVGVSLPGEAAHVHGVGADPDTGEVFVATHNGLYRIPAPGAADGAEPASPEKIGPTIDLMGFSIAGPGRFIASGHPGPGTDMPDPVGLIESLDGGRSWRSLSLEGESDFHALASGAERTVGFDGRLRATEDGRTWEDLAGGVEPFALAVSDDGATLLATTAQGLRRSSDGGTAFTPVPDAPALALVAWVAGTGTVYGVAVDGGVHRSTDAGADWTRTGAVEGEPQALYADGGQILVVADHRVTRSTDAGATFRGW